MKTISSFLFASALAVGLGAAGVSSATDLQQSPRARSMQTILTPPSGSSPNLVAGNSYGPAAKLESARGHIAPGSGKDVNLVSGMVTGPAAKGPYVRSRETRSTLRASRGSQCRADCAVTCCAKN